MPDRGIAVRSPARRASLGGRGRASRSSPRDAVMRGSCVRLRTRLMLTFAFVAGMIPLILSNGVGAGANPAIGVVLFGGQSMALLLTLIVTPVAYSLFDDALRLRLVG